MAQNATKIEFNSQVIDKKPCSITISVSVKAQEALKEVDVAFENIQRQAKIDGFRQGKAPLSVIKEKFSKEAKDRAVESIVNKTVFNSLSKEKFVPVDFPIVEEFDYELGKDCNFKFTAECAPDVEIKNYKEIPVKKEIYKVTEKSLKQSLDALLERNANLEPSKTGVVKEDSFVSVDYEGFDLDGKPIENIKEKNHMLDLGSENTVKGFQKALKGAKIGDVKDAKIEYPKDYPNKTLAGKTVVFKTKVLEIKEKVLPGLNDEFAKDMGCQNLEELKKKVQEAIESEEKRRQDMDVEKQIMDYLLDKNKFEVPTVFVNEQNHQLEERMKNFFKSQGLPEDFINKQLESRKKETKDEAEKNVRLSYILNGIFKKEKLDITDADLKAEKEKMKASNPQREAAVEKYFTEKKETIMLSLKEQKLFKFLLDNAKISEVVKDMPLKKKND